MVTEVIEAPVTAAAPTDPEPQTVQTEEPTTPVVEPAAEPTDAAAVPQVEVTEQKPDYMTRADWEREKAEVGQRAASEALELDRRRRQTENARKAKDEVREREEQQEAADVIRAALVAQGFDPAAVSDEAVTRTVDRLARKKADRMGAGSLDTVDQAWDYLSMPAYQVTTKAQSAAAFDALDERTQEAAARLGPKLQQLVNALQPAIEAKAREGYIPESELQKRYEAMDAARNAKAREGQTEIRHVEGSASTGTMSWTAYMSLPESARLAMPDAERRQIMAADRKARLGQ